MIERYSRPEMAAIWSDKVKYELWLLVELAVCRSLAKKGKIPKAALANISKKAAFDVARINEIEKEVRHDVIAFLTSVSEKIGPDSSFVHMGMTSSDLLDTAFAMQLVKAGELIESDILKLLGILKKRAHEFKDTVMIGRTHGIHGEPVTFGLKFAIWHSEFSRHLKRLKDALFDIAVGKLSGAVGTFAHIDPQVEKEVMKELSLEPAPASNQVVQRDRHAHFFAVLAGMAASVEKIATEIRHLQRTEVGEAAESFGKGQKGSSAMPHKRNPILCENLCGLARVVRANSMAAFENVALWHERDISHSSVERVIAPDSTILVDFMLSRLSDVIANMDVYPERMLANLNMSHGLYNSQDIMLLLVEKGFTREDAYRAVQDAAMRSWKESKNFKDILLKDKKISAKISKNEIEKVFDIKRHTKYVDEIFERVFGKY